MKSKKKRRLAAIMFTDIIGYTALMQQDEAQAVAIRTRHRQVFEEQHQRHHGEILQYFGDGTLSIFQSGVEAVASAIAIQRHLQKGEKVPLRIGLHLGDIVFDGTDIYGDSVNLTSRIESMGISGAVLLSGRLNEELKNQQQILTESLGYFDFKNITNPVEVFAVINEGIKRPTRAELKSQGKQKQTAKNIAVLPLVNMSTSEENEYFSDGMTEEIINALAKIKALKVTSRTSSFFYKNKKIPLRQIGEELNVSTILEGSIRLSGNKIRITVQLVDVENDFHFWSETFNRSLEDVFAVQDEISLLIADKLREHIGHFEIDAQLVETKNVSVSNYQKYLKSRYHILKMTKQDIELGMSILEELIEQQPTFALAHLGMHLSHTLLGVMGFAAAEVAFMNGYAYLQQAVELDENLPECQIHLSYDALLQQWDFSATYEHLQNAFAIRPSVEYYQSMASTLGAERKFDAALYYIDIAFQLDPFSEINCHLKGFIFYAQEKYAKAIFWFDKAIKAKSSFVVSIYYKGQAYLLMGNAQEALAIYENLPADEAEDVTKLGFVTLANAALGEKKATEKGIQKLENALDSPSGSKAISALMLIYAVLKKESKAMEFVKKGIELRLPMMVYLYVEPLLKSLYSIPAFQELVKKILGEKTTFDFSKRKYKKVLLEKAVLKKYKLRLEKLMSTEKPYLDPNLSLRNLAVKLDIPANQLSQLLNEGFDKNFSEFVNTYRLETFKTKIADPANSHFTILGLAYEAGFNSKTVFNTFFKKMMGKTPKAYWKEIKP